MKPGWVIPHVNMEIKLNIQNTENLANLSKSDIYQIETIVNALVASGGCTGVKGGQAIIHFDADGLFQKVQLNYFPWVRRKL